MALFVLILQPGRTQRSRCVFLQPGWDARTKCCGHSRAALGSRMQGTHLGVDPRPGPAIGAHHLLLPPFNHVRRGRGLGRGVPATERRSGSANRRVKFCSRPRSRGSCAGSRPPAPPAAERPPLHVGRPGSLAPAAQLPSTPVPGPGTRPRPRRARLPTARRLARPPAPFP